MTSVRDKRCFTALAAAALLSAAFVWPAEAQMPASLSLSTEFPAETAAIVAATSELFDSVEATEAPRGQMPVIARPVLATPASFAVIDAKAGVLTEMGPVDHLTGYRISWYPVDRFLGSVDFMGTWADNRNLVCGYVTWDMSDPAAPVLEDVSATFLEISDFTGQTDSEIHAALLDANCAFGAVDANYAFFE